MIAAVNIYRYLEQVTRDERAPIAPVLLFAGTDRYLSRQVINLLIRRLIPDRLREWNLTRLPRATWGEILAQLRRPALAGTVVVVSPLPESEADRDAFLTYLGSPGPAVLILEADEMPKGALGRSLEIAGTIVKCPAPTRQQMGAVVKFALTRAGLTADDDAARHLAAHLPLETRAAVDAASRLSWYLGDQTHVDRVAAEAVCPPTAETAVWALTDARSPAEAVKVWEALIAQGENPAHLLQLLQRHYALLLEAPAAKARLGSSDRAAKAIGAHPYVFGKALRLAATRPPEHWAGALSLVVTVQDRLRQRTMPESALPMVLAQLPYRR